jgi:hemoglobin-like flavoprotein
VTPDELGLIEQDGTIVRDRADEFARAFYDTLFEVAPSTRDLFPDDMTAQRTKLVDELGFLIETATGAAASGDLSPFLDRARELGRRHVGYGVTGADFGPVGSALLAALGDVVEGWDDHHAAAWDKLYRLIGDVMREGAAGGVASGR